MNRPRLILSSDLALTGRDSRTLAKLCNNGTLKRVRHGVYLKTEEWATLSRASQYGLRAEPFRHVAPTEPVFCHAPAALLWGFWIVGTPRSVHVRTEVTAGGRNRNGIRRRIGAETDAVVRCGQFLVTDKLTTTIQLINKLGFPHAVAVCDSSLRPLAPRKQLNQFAKPGEATGGEAVWVLECPQGLPLRVEDLKAAAVLLPRQAARNRALAVIDFASPLSGSPGESISRAKMHELGFPAPVLQKGYSLRDGSDAFVDFWFEEQNLAGEFDGKAKYQRPDWAGGLSMEDRLWHEKVREDDIRGQGVQFVRWTWAEMNDSSRFERLLRRAGLPQKRR